MRRDTIKHLMLTYGPLLAALAIELVVFELIGRSQGIPGFASWQSLMGVLNQSAVFGIMAVGMTFIIITAGIDLSVGSLLAFCGVVCAVVVSWGGDSHVWAWLLLGWCAALALGFASGGFAGLCVTWFDIPPFIATLALMSALRGLANLTTAGTTVSDLPGAYTWLGRHNLGGVLPVSVVVFALVILVGWILLEHTVFGRNVRAIGGNEEAARLSGIPIARVKRWVYILGGVLTGVAGLIQSSRLGAGSPKIGVADELAVIAAVVVGGTSLSGGKGTIPGTVVGLLVVSTLNSGLNWIGVETFGQQVTLGMVILAAVLLDKLKTWGESR